MLWFETSFFQYDIFYNKKTFKYSQQPVNCLRALKLVAEGCSRVPKHAFCFWLKPHGLALDCKMCHISSEIYVSLFMCQIFIKYSKRGILSANRKLNRSHHFLLFLAMLFVSDSLQGCSHFFTCKQLNI